MASNGDEFRDYIVEYIKSWGEELQIDKEKHVGMRFVGTPRKIDIVIRNPKNGKAMGIECKFQMTGGTNYEKFSYALEDCLAAPIPCIIVFAGEEIRIDMQSKLITSGIGIEVGFLFDDLDKLSGKPQKDWRVTEIVDPANMLRQRAYMELGLDWFPYLNRDNIKDKKNYGDAYMNTLKKKR